MKLVTFLQRIFNVFDIETGTEQIVVYNLIVGLCYVVSILSLSYQPLFCLLYSH